MCGDGVLNPGEQCDSGMGVTADGCIDPGSASDVNAPGCWDYVLYARTDCADAQTELGCADTWWDTPETLTFAVQAETSYFVFVEGYDDSTWSKRPYNLHIEQS